MEGKKSSTSNSSSNANQLQVAPFVAKTYEMVSDRRTDALIRWGRGNNSFLVLDPALFSQLLLPSYFKHSNFSSFVRQLNTYGFRKVDPDRWEFAHESFLRGQTHLLPLIVRRRKEDGNSSGEREGTSVAVEEEDEMLLLEVGKLWMEQQALEEELHGMNKRLQATEKRPQQMASFLSQVAEDPDFLPHLIISQKEQHKVQQPQQLAAEKKRRLLIPSSPHPPPPPPPPLPHAPQLTTSGPVPYQTAGVAHIAGYNDGVAVAPAIPTSSSIGVDSSGSQLLFLPEFGVSPAPAFPFSLLGEGFF